LQLDPHKRLSPQLLKATGRDLERLVAAIMHSLGYTVFRNFALELEGEDVGEADVFATLETPFRESRLLFECKGGHPSFTEIRQFASLAHCVEPRPDEAVIVANYKCPQNRKHLAEKLGLALLEKNELARFILPLLKGTSSRSERVIALNVVLAAFTVHDFLIKVVPEVDEMKAHYRFLSHVLWWKEEPRKQLKESWEAATGEYSETSKKVAEARGKTARSAIASPNDDHVQAAMLVELLHRIINMYVVVRCATTAQRRWGQEFLLEDTGLNLREAMVLITQNLRAIYGFPSFFQHWLFTWGGFIWNPRKAWEVSRLAEECCTTVGVIESYFDIIRLTYSSKQSGSLIYEDSNLTFFKWVPAAFRALGRRYRVLLDQDYYSSCKIFKEDALNDVALGRALADIGGLRGLKWS